jgi:hypothetical protein
VSLKDPNVLSIGHSGIGIKDRHCAWAVGYGAVHGGQLAASFYAVMHT